MLTIILDDALAARVEAAISQAKIADANTFATAAISEALAKLEPSQNGTTNGTMNGAAFAAPARTAGEKPLTEFKPLAQFIDEQRIKHGFPDDWPHSEKYAMTDADWDLINRQADEIMTDEIAWEQANRIK